MGSSSGSAPSAGTQNSPKGNTYETFDQLAEGLGLAARKWGSNQVIRSRNSGSRTLYASSRNKLLTKRNLSCFFRGTVEFVTGSGKKKLTREERMLEKEAFGKGGALQLLKRDLDNDQLYDSILEMFSDTYGKDLAHSESEGGLTRKDLFNLKLIKDQIIDLEEQNPGGKLINRLNKYQNNAVINQMQKNPVADGSADLVQSHRPSVELLSNEPQSKNPSQLQERGKVEGSIPLLMSGPGYSLDQMYDQSAELSAFLDKNTVKLYDKMKDPEAAKADHEFDIALSDAGGIFTDPDLSKESAEELLENLKEKKENLFEVLLNSKKPGVVERSVKMAAERAVEQLEFGKEARCMAPSQAENQNEDSNGLQVAASGPQGGARQYAASVRAKRKDADVGMAGLQIANSAIGGVQVQAAKSSEELNALCDKLAKGCQQLNKCSFGVKAGFQRTIQELGKAVEELQKEFDKPKNEIDYEKYDELNACRQKQASSKDVLNCIQVIQSLCKKGHEHVAKFHTNDTAGSTVRELEGIRDSIHTELLNFRTLYRQIKNMDESVGKLVSTAYALAKCIGKSAESIAVTYCAAQANNQNLESANWSELRQLGEEHNFSSNPRGSEEYSAPALKSALHEFGVPLPDQQKLYSLTSQIAGLSLKFSNIVNNAGRENNVLKQGDNNALGDIAIDGNKMAGYYTKAFYHEALRDDLFRGIRQAEENLSVLKKTEHWRKLDQRFQLEAYMSRCWDNRSRIVGWEYTQ